jgi:hypothetical protein
MRVNGIKFAIIHHLILENNMDKKGLLIIGAGGVSTVATVKCGMTPKC